MLASFCRCVWLSHFSLPLFCLLPCSLLFRLPVPVRFHGLARATGVRAEPLSLLRLDIDRPARGRPTSAQPCLASASPRRFVRTEECVEAVDEETPDRLQWVPLDHLA